MPDRIEFQPTDNAWTCIINDLCLSELQIAMVVTGGGTGAISRCLRRSGASINFVEAVIPYSRMATQTYLGFEPTNGYASPSTAKALAQTAHCRAVSFSKAPQQALGIALTATLPTKPPGSDARLTQNCCIHVASQGKDLARGWSLCFAAKPSEREVSEAVAEQMFLIALQDSLHQHGFPIRSELVQPLNDGGFTVTMAHADDR